jgi:GNAT superfamily N-acetyltransferase
MPDPPSSTFVHGWWQCVAVTADRTPTWFAYVWSDRHSAGSRVELLAEAAERECGDEAVCVAAYDGHKVTALQVRPRGAPKAPPVWFAEIRQSTARPPAVNLVAFTEHGVAAGSLVDEPELAELDVRTADQLGAVRWYPASGEVDQVYVQPEWRRRTVAGALIAAAATLSGARDWPRLWSDGQRTVDGEQLRNASSWRYRTADLTHTAPPMTPGETAPSGFVTPPPRDSEG